MAFIPWPNSIKLVFEFVIAGVPVTVTIATTKPSAIAPGDVANVANTARTWAVTELMPTLTNGIELTRVTAYNMTTSTGEVQVNTTGLPQAGTVNETPIDIGSAMDVSFRTPNRGRSGRGRNYVPGLSSIDRPDAATFASGQTTATGAAYAELDDYLALEGFDHTVASEQLDGVVRNPAVMQSVTSYIANTAIANQRGRSLWNG